MSPTDWNWRHPVEHQDYPWDCSAAALAWALQACGHPYTEQDVIAGLGPGRISPELGLLDASGAGLVDWLGEIGIPADNDASATYQEIAEAAGHQPMVIGGRAWYHWVGVRMSPLVIDRTYPNALAIANTAPGYFNIDQVLWEPDIEMLGPFSAVWLLAW